MAKNKLLQCTYTNTKTVYCVVKRNSDGYLLNDADGTFTSAPTDFYISMTENSNVKGLYEKTEARTAWKDGEYTMISYEQLSGTPSTLNDFLLGSKNFYIKNDIEINNDNLSNLLISIGSINETNKIIKKELDEVDSKLKVIYSTVNDILNRIAKRY